MCEYVRSRGTYILLTRTFRRWFRGRLLLLMPGLERQLLFRARCKRCYSLLQIYIDTFKPYD